MKKYTAYIFAIAALLLASCSEKELNPNVEGPADHCIELTFSNVHPSLETKAAIRGVNEYNENLIQKVDCFFYPNGATDSPAVFTAMGRGVKVREVASDSLVYTVKIFFTDDDAEAMFGNSTSGTCQAYVICNAPLSYGSDTSVDALKDLILEHDFSAQIKQGSFVMSANEPATVTLTTTGTGANAVTSASGLIKVMRSAAKMQLYFLIPSELYDPENNETWYPAMDIGVQIRMANLVKRGKVNGNYSVQTADYVTTRYRNVESVNTLEGASAVPGMTEYNYTSIPFYSYPQNWHDLSDYAPAFVFRIPWRMGSNSNYEYRTYQLSPNMSGLKFEANHYYRSYVKISSLGGADDEHYVTITDASYIILDWLDESTTAGQGAVPGALTTYKYLVVDQDKIELNNEVYAYYTYVTSSPLNKIKFTSIEYINNLQNPPHKTYTFTGSTGEKETATGSVSFTVDTKTNTFSYDFSEPGVVTLYHPLTDVYTQWIVHATIYNQDGCSQDIVMTQNPSIRLECNYDNKGDVFVDGHFNRVTDAKFGLRWQNTGNYGADNLYYYTSNTTSTNHYQVGTKRVDGVDYNYNDYGSISRGKESGEQPIYTTEVNVTSFNTGNYTYSCVIDGVASNPEYLIGDPRVKASSVYASWTLHPYLYWTGSAQAYDYWESPGDILITTQDPAKQNYIAPRFLVSSTLNGQSQKPGFNNAVKRGAVYQEAGYPAGRWRLPTEAELAFLYERQFDKTIPELFGSGKQYLTASGRYMTIDGQSKTVTFTSLTNLNAATSNTGNPSSRLVYDLWYWGSPSTTNEYHPNGHLYNYDAAGNATLITR